MKNIKLLLLLIVSLNGFGQKEPSPFIKGYGIKLVDQKLTPSLSHTITFRSEPERIITKDSVLVLMMVTDTARKMHVSELLIQYFDSTGRYITVDPASSYLDTTYSEPDLSVKTMVGYRVSDRYDINNTMYPPIYIKYEYLDDKKQPLSKSIIVWQTVNQK